MAEITQEPLPNAPPIDRQKQPKRNRALLGLTIILLLLGLAWFYWWFNYLRFYETTEDAYVNGNMVNVTSVISGLPIAFFADSTDLVEEGQLLVLLDPTEYRIQYERELANLAATALEVVQIYEAVKTNQLSVQNRRVLVDRARFDYESRHSLLGSRAVTKEEYVHAKDTLDSAEIELRQAEKQLEIALAAAGPTPMEKHPNIERQKAIVWAAFYNLKHCSILAPVTGYVAQRAVEVGQWVNSNTALMAIIPSNYMWVDANFKETQLRDMRIGQPANVTFDLYGSGVEFEGKVLGIASGTGSVFSLIPPQNATGNWIKIVQRLPVRIGLDLNQIKQFPLRLGLSAKVTVNISDNQLPMLAQVPSKTPIASTSVYDLDFAEVDQAINQILSEYLKLPES